MKILISEAEIYSPPARTACRSVHLRYWWMSV